MSCICAQGVKLVPGVHTNPRLAVSQGLLLCTGGKGKRRVCTLMWSRPEFGPVFQMTCARIPHKDVRITGLVMTYGIATAVLPDEIGLYRLFLHWVRDAGGAACFDAFEEPCHIAAEFAHYLHSLFVLTHLVRCVAVDHVPVFR